MFLVKLTKSKELSILHYLFCTFALLKQITIMQGNKKPLIFITNDDGVHAKGINDLIKSFRDLGEIFVIAPEGARSGMSSAITTSVPLQVKKLNEEDDLTIYSCTGTPVDCVKLGVDEILDRKPDLLVSGINHGSNAAVSVIYSGTIGAAIEGCIVGIPSIGISLTDHSTDADFSEAARLGKQVAKKVLQTGLPNGTCLNLNIPNIEKVAGIKICAQTKGRWVKEFLLEKDSNGELNYRLTGSFHNEEPENSSTDEWVLKEGYASLVPVKIDMTDYSFIEELKHWEE